MPLINFRKFDFLKNNFQKSCKMKYFSALFFERKNILFFPILFSKFLFRTFWKCFFQIFLNTVLKYFRKKIEFFSQKIFFEKNFFEKNLEIFLIFFWKFLKKIFWVFEFFDESCTKKYVSFSLRLHIFLIGPSSSDS